MQNLAKFARMRFLLTAPAAGSILCKLLSSPNVKVLNYSAGADSEQIQYAIWLPQSSFLIIYKGINMPNEWVKEIDIAITVTDREGRYIEMNDKSLSTFAKDGGAGLIGTDIMLCHNENSNSILRNMIESGSKNIYIVEKEGLKKLIFQSPWTKDGEFHGLVELSIVLPDEIEVKKRG